MTATNEASPDPRLDALLAEAGWVLALAKRLARDQAAAEDIAQSTLALALERRPSVEGGLRPWLATVVGRLARRTDRSELRRRDREARTVLDRDPTSDGGAEALERFEVQQELARRVRELPEPYRGLLIRRYYEGLSVKEIARASASSPGTVRSQLARGLERLRGQYVHESGSRGALGIFLSAANSGTGFLSRRTAELVLMQTSTKIVAATAAVLLVVAVAVIGPDFDRSNRELAPAGVGAPSLSESLAREGELARADLEAATDSGERTAMKRETSAADETPSAAVAEDDGPSVSVLRARILDGDRRPLAGATLSSVHSDGRARGPENFAQSDGAGRVVLELTDDALRKWRDETYDMLFAASASGHATEFVMKRPKFHGETDLGDLLLGPGGALVGVCVDRSGRPIEGALLVASTGSSHENWRLRGPSLEVPRPRTISAADGSFELAGLPAQLTDGRALKARLWAHAPGHHWTRTEPLTIEKRVDVGRIVLEELSRELRIDGVVFRANGLPAAGARVEFASTGDPFVGTVEADANGRFFIVPRDAAPVDLVAYDPTKRAGPSRTKSMVRGERVELRLLSRRVLSVTVVDTDGDPVDDAHLRPIQANDALANADGGRLVPGTDWSYTNAAGQVTLAMPGGSFALWARKTGFESNQQGPFENASAPEDVTLVMPRGAELTGRVLAYGEPVEGARVSGLRRLEGFVALVGDFPNRYGSEAESVLTDSEGRFVVPLKLDWTGLGLLARYEALALGEVALDVLPGVGVRNIEIHLTEGGAIEGQVSPPRGREVAGLFVAASRGDGRPVSTIVDARGRYRLEGLTPGDWRVEGRLREVGTQTVAVSRRPEVMEPRWNAVVVDRETLKLDLDMRGLGDADVHGQLLIDGAAPPPDWSVEIVGLKQESGFAEVGTAELDSEGRFVVSARPGRVELRLRGSIPGGARVEMVREIQLTWPRFEWEGTLSTGPVVESLDGRPERARFVRGREGDRELSLVPVDESGLLRARVPIGWSSLEVPVADAPDGEAWEFVRQVDVSL